jgi:hypothetical protein
VPDDDQDGPADRDKGLLFTAAAGDAPVAFAEEDVGLSRGDGGVAQYPGEVGVAVAGGVLALLLPGGLLDPGRELRQDTKCPEVGKRSMSTPISATITYAAVGLMPGISRRALKSRGFGHVARQTSLSARRRCLLGACSSAPVRSDSTRHGIGLMRWGRDGRTRTKRHVAVLRNTARYCLLLLGVGNFRLLIHRFWVRVPGALPALTCGFAGVAGRLMSVVGPWCDHSRQPSPSGVMPAGDCSPGGVLALRPCQQDLGSWACARSAWAS